MHFFKKYASTQLSKSTSVSLWSSVQVYRFRLKGHLRSCTRELLKNTCKWRSNPACLMPASQRPPSLATLFHDGCPHDVTFTHTTYVKSRQIGSVASSAEAQPCKLKYAKAKLQLLGVQYARAVFATVQLQEKHELFMRHRCSTELSSARVVGRDKRSIPTPPVGRASWHRSPSRSSSPFRQTTRPSTQGATAPKRCSRRWISSIRICNWGHLSNQQHISE